MTLITYTNMATNEQYELGIELLENETDLEAAWSRGFKVCQLRTRWQSFDIKVKVN